MKTSEQNSDRWKIVEKTQERQTMTERNYVGDDYMDRASPANRGWVVSRKSLLFDKIGLLLI